MRSAPVRPMAAPIVMPVDATLAMAAGATMMTGVAMSAYDGKPSVVLRESIFYPEGGGQLGDLGELRVGDQTVRVLDTQIDDAGTIHQIVERAVEGGDDVVVSGSIDVARRRDHMA